MKTPKDFENVRNSIITIQDCFGQTAETYGWVCHRKQQWQDDAGRIYTGWPDAVIFGVLKWPFAYSYGPVSCKIHWLPGVPAINVKVWPHPEAGPKRFMDEACFQVNRRCDMPADMFPPAIPAFNAVNASDLQAVSPLAGYGESVEIGDLVTVREWIAGTGAKGCDGQTLHRFDRQGRLIYE